MLNRLRVYFAPPVFEDAEKTRVTELLYTILRALLIASVALGGVVSVIGPADSRAFLWEVTATATCAVVLTFLLARRGHVRPAIGVITLTYFGLITLAIIRFGGIRSPATAAYLVLIVWAGLLLGGRGAVAFAALAALAALGVEVAGARDLLPESFEVFLGARAWFIYASLSGLTAALVHIATTSIHQARERATRAFLDSQRQARELASLYETAVAVSNVPETRDLLARLYEQVRKLIAPDTFAVVFYEPDGEWLEMAMVMEGGEPLKEAQGLKVPMDQGGLTGWVIRSRAPLLVGDLQREALPVAPRHMGQEARAWLGVPLLARDRLIGVISLQSFQPGVFDDADRRFLEALAGPIAAALENTRLYERARDRLREMTALQSASQVVSSSLELSQILQNVVRLLHDTFGYAYLALYLLRGQLLKLAAHAGYTEELIITEIPVTAGVSGRAVRTQQIQFVPDAAADPDFLRASYEVSSEICVPLLREGTVLGVLSVEAAPDRPLTQADVDLLATFATQLTVAIENARLFDAERRQRELAVALREVSAALSASLDFNTILDRLLEEVARVIPYDAANVWLVEGTSRRVRVARMRSQGRFAGEVSPAAATLEFDLETTPNLRHMADTGQPLVIPDTAAYSEWVPAEAASHVRSWAGAPIVAHGQFIAFLSVDKVQPGFYQAEHGELLAAFAGQAALALQNARLYQAERGQRRLAETLHDVSNTLNSTFDLGLILDRLLEELDQLLGYDSAAVMLLELDEFRVAAGRGFPDPQAIADFRAPRSANPLFAEIQRTRRPLVLADAQADPRFQAWAGTTYIRGWIGAPLVAHGQIIGALTVDSRTPGAYGNREAEIAGAFATQAAVAIENARLYEEIRRRAQMLEALYATSLDIAVPHDLQGLLQTIVERATRLSNAPAGGLYLCEPENQQVRQVVSYNTSRDYTGAILKYGEGAAGRVAQTGQPLRVADYRTWPGRSEIFEVGGVTAVLSVPLLWQGETTGVIHLLHTDPGRMFSRADEELLTLFASQAAIAVENARLLQQTRQRLFEQTLLYECGRDLATARDPLESIAAVTERMVRHLRATAMCYYSYDETANTIRTEYEYWTPWATPRELQSVLGEAWPLSDYPTIAAALKARKSRTLRRADPDLSPEERQMMREYGGKVVTIVPMFIYTRVIGYFEIWASREDPEYSEADLRLMTAVAGQAAISVENARLLNETRRRADEVRMLYDATREFTAGLDEESVLHAIVRRTMETLQSGGCTVSLWDQDNDRVITLLTQSRLGETAVDAPGTSYPLSDYPATRRVLESREPQLVQADDPVGDPAEQALIRELGYDGVLMLPMVAGDEVLGLVEVFQGPGNEHFSKDQVALAYNLATQAATALVNARLHTETRRLAAEQALLYDATRDFSAGLDAQEVKTAVVRHGLHALGAIDCTISIWDRERDAVVTVTTIASPREGAESSFDVPGTAYPLSHFPSTRYVLEKRQPLIVRSGDPEADPAELALMEAWGCDSLLMVPLATGDQVFGVVEFYRAKGRPVFSGSDVNLGQALAAQAAVALANANLHTEVHALAVTDSLTNLPNYRALDKALHREFARASRYGQPLSILILDIDSFKVYNDSYGHPAGNERLRSIANMLRETVRDPDLAARYGGEEFAILLPNTDKAGALALAHRLRVEGEAAAPGAASPGEVIPGYTLSIGVASFPADADSANDLLLAADNAELVAKRTGKNRVVEAANTLSLTLPASVVVERSS